MSTMETNKLRIIQKAKRKEKKAVIHHKYGTTVLKIESLFGFFPSWLILYDVFLQTSKTVPQGIIS